MLDFSAVRDLPVCSDGWDLLSRSSGRESFSYCWVSVFECTVCLLCLMLFAARYRDLSVSADYINGRACNVWCVTQFGLSVILLLLTAVSRPDLVTHGFPLLPRHFFSSVERRLGTPSASPRP